MNPLCLLILALCLSASFSLPSLFTCKQTCRLNYIRCCLLPQQFFRNSLLETEQYGHITLCLKCLRTSSKPEVNKFLNATTWPRHFLRDFPPRKTRVAQIHRTIYSGALAHEACLRSTMGK